MIVFLIVYMGEFVRMDNHAPLHASLTSMSQIGISKPALV